MLERGRAVRTALVLGLALAGRAAALETAPGAPAAVPAAPARCACPRADAPAGLLWRGPEPIGMPQIAALAAPVLWFSPDEPLLASPDHPPPDPHPCDAPSSGAVVYWSVDRIRLRGDEKVTTPAADDPRIMEKARRLVVRFLFYYREDIGVGRHPNDIEMADQALAFDRAPDGCWEIRVEEVTAYAHGVDWYSNQLVVEKDTRLPITILVEEGKHASCPDRNADGVYTPGYDVNRRVNDAWGVRDVVGSGFLVSSGYESSMTKTRPLDDRMLPPEAGPTCATGRRSSLRDPEESLGRYALREARGVGTCPQAPDPKELAASMRLNHFGLGYDPPQQRLDLPLELSLAGTGSILGAFAIRWDRAIGVALYLRGFDLRELYVVPRLSLVRGPDLAAELLVTGAAARFLSGYFSLGASRERTDGQIAWRFVTEAGTKFRVTLSGWQRALSLGYQFAGFRFGVRSDGFDSISHLRFVVEAGAGVW